MLNFLQTLDDYFLRLTRDTLANDFFDWLMPILSDKRYLAGPLFLLVLFLLIKGGKKGRVSVLVLAVSVLLTDVVASHLMKPACHRLRPYQRELLLTGRPVTGSYSLPSSHSANIAAGGAALALSFPAAIAPSVLIWAGVSYSRVYLNHHYPIDCLAGLLTGILLALAVHYGVKYLLVAIKKKKGRVKHASGKT